MLHPVITVGADKLLKSSSHTLQRTLLLQKEVESERVENELKAKLEEFRLRMDACEQKRRDIEFKQNEVRYI